MGASPLLPSVVEGKLSLREKASSWRKDWIGALRGCSPGAAGGWGGQGGYGVHGK